MFLFQVLTFVCFEFDCPHRYSWSDPSGRTQMTKETVKLPSIHWQWCTDWLAGDGIAAVNDDQATLFQNINTFQTTTPQEGLTKTLGNTPPTSRLLIPANAGSPTTSAGAGGRVRQALFLCSRLLGL